MSNILYELETTRRGAYSRLQANEKGKMIPIISDIMFQTMINNEQRKKYLTLIISEVLNIDYDYLLDNLQIRKNTLDKNLPTEAEKTLDCLCEYKDMLINIEMNDLPDKDRLNRNEEYLRNLFSQRKIGDDYIYKEAIQININNFSFVGISDTMHRYENKETLLGRDLIMSKNFKTYHIYLPKIREKFYNKEKLSRLELFMVVLNEKEDSNYLNELIKGELVMKEYREESSILSMDDDMWLAYQLERINNRYKEAKEHNLKQEGNKEATENIIKNMLNKNMDIKLISEVTGLTEEEINNIKKSID